MYGEELARANFLRGDEGVLVYQLQVMRSDADASRQPPPPAPSPGGGVVHAEAMQYVQVRADAMGMHACMHASSPQACACVTRLAQPLCGRWS